MAGKIKYLIALTVVMYMIYMQGDFVIYAGGVGQTNIKGENTAVPGDGGDAGAEGGSQENAGDVQDKTESEGDGGGDAGDGEEEKPPLPEEKPIEKYETKIPEADGNEGYYIRKPEVAIRHVSERGATRYRLTHGDKMQEERTLKGQGEKAVIDGKAFEEGKNILHIWMEDEDGKKLEEFEMKKEFLVDTKAPEIHMSVPRGFETWYQGKTVLSVKGDGTGSKIEKITCKLDGKVLGNTDKAQGDFLIAQASEQGKGVEVTIAAQDRAGNRSERVKTVYIDNKPPRLKLSGAKDYMIAGRDIMLTCETEEENMFQEYYAEIIWENVKGKRKSLPASAWGGDGTKRTLSQKLDKDGTYYIKAYVKDASGQAAEEEMQIIIDKTDPVIRRVETLRGKYLKKFRWDYPPNKMIWDFTTYSYEVRVDGRLYHMGETIDSEGAHKMTVKVTDAAGNKAQSSAEFIIDRTAPEIVFRNIENGGEYEEERTFKAEVKGTEDAIRQILINGEEQKLTPGNRAYEYTLDVCKDYEVTVKAADMAGNTSEKNIYFRIVPKKTFAESFADKVLFRKHKPEKSKKTLEGRQNQEVNGGNFSKKTFGIGLLGIAPAIGAILFWMRRKQEEQKAVKTEL